MKKYANRQIFQSFGIMFHSKIRQIYESRLDPTTLTSFFLSHNVHLLNEFFFFFLITSL